MIGFGYGAAGIAWALLELTAVSGEERFAAAAGQAVAYERAHFSTEAQNWPDLRQIQREGSDPEPQPPRYPAAYCFGAAGIGLARLQALPHLQDPLLKGEIEIALKTTIDHGFGLTHCLCHGDLGNIELLLEIDKKSGFLKKPGFSDEIDKISAMILENITRDGRQSGGPVGIEIPGLMLGTAGIGYQLLRLARPDLIPSVLLLAPPIRTPVLPYKQDSDPAIPLSP